MYRVCLTIRRIEQPGRLPGRVPSEPNGEISTNPLFHRWMRTEIDGCAQSLRADRITDNECWKRLAWRRALRGWQVRLRPPISWLPPLSSWFTLRFPKDEPLDQTGTHGFLGRLPCSPFAERPTFPSERRGSWTPPRG